MTDTQITNTIKKTQKKVNTLSSMSNLDGDIAINIEIKATDYNEFETVQNRIENEVTIKRNQLNICLFFKWIRK